MFSGDVQCVYCGLKIAFFGNNISYQKQRCADHNHEHQFPGMNILINHSDIVSKNPLPEIFTAPTQSKDPSAWAFQTSDKALHNYAQHSQAEQKGQIVTKQTQYLPIAASLTHGHHKGNITFQMRKTLHTFINAGMQYPNKSNIFFYFR